MSGKHFTPAQLRGARGLLAWSVAELAYRAVLTPGVVESYEAGRRDLSPAAMARLVATLRGAGVRPIASKLAGEGVRFIRPAGMITTDASAARTASGLSAW